MKKAHIAAILFASLTLAAGVHAESRQQALQTCSVYRDKAIEIMQIRQQEAPSIQLSQALDIYGGTDMGEILVLKAYREPKYPDHLQSVRSEERFSGEVMLRCYTASRSFGIPRTDETPIEKQK